MNPADQLKQHIATEESQKTFFDLLAEMMRDSGAKELRFRQNQDQQCWDIDFIYADRRIDWHCTRNAAHYPSTPVIVNAMLHDMAMSAGIKFRGPLKTYRVHYTDATMGLPDRGHFAVVAQSEAEAREQVVKTNHSPLFRIERIEEVSTGK